MTMTGIGNPSSCALAVLALLSASGRAHAETPCQRRILQNNPVVVCTADVSKTAIRLHWKSKDGQAYGSLRPIANGSAAGPGPLLFAMNAGMYHGDLTPVGLYVENRRELVRANTARGPGNFHLQPNGVFHVGGGAVGVTETKRFISRQSAVEFATQSGPMLVIDGRLHPKITGSGQSRKIRNGVGVSGGRTAQFVITETPVTFTEFARMFRDDLKTPNALYLDGSISSLTAPSVGRSDGFMPVGPIVAVYGLAR